MKKLTIPKSIRQLIVGLILFNILWYILAIIFQNKVLPNPIEVYKIFPTTFSKGMSAHLWASLWRICIGILISLIIGLIFGIILALSKRTNKIFQPLLYLSYPIPKLALMPAVMIIFGIGETTKIVMIVLIIVFQIIISVRDAIYNISRENFYVFHSLRASQWQTIKHIILPAILPEIMSALRVSVGIATSVLFVTETFGTDKGLGYFIVDSWMRIDYITMYVGIVTLSTIGFLLFLLIDSLDNLFCKWNKI